MDNRPVALVFTMGKCGSSTVMNVLRSIGRNPERGYKQNLSYLKTWREYETVTVVMREPVGWGISYMFEKLGNEFVSESMSLEEIWAASLFYITRSQEHWCRNVLTPYIGLGIFTKNFRFNKTNGWYIDIKFPTLLFIQTERLSDQLGIAFQKLYNLPEPVPVEHRASTSSTRPYGQLYQEFLTWVKYPPDMIEEIYARPYAKVFYSRDERERLTRRWSSK